MATTETTTADPKPATTYSLLVVFTLDARSEEHLPDQQAIRDEATSWLQSLDATVHGVNVRQAD
jgi:hypothetical protein